MQQRDGERTKNYVKYIGNENWFQVLPCAVVLGDVEYYFHLFLSLNSSAAFQAYKFLIITEE